MNLKNLLILIIFLLIVLVVPVEAASFNLSASSSKVKPSSTFTIKVGGDCIGRVNLSVSNGKLSDSSVWVEQNSVSVTVTAGTSGVVRITATPTTGFSDADANEYNPGSRSVTVSIIEDTPSAPTNPTNPTTPSTSPSNVPSSSKPNTSSSSKSQDKRSSNNRLKSLTVEGFDLSPKFNSETTKYSLNLPNTTTNIKISATTEDEKAKINDLGEIKVKPGNNEIKITVIAENGSKKTYKINAYVDEAPTMFLDYNDEKIGLVRNLDNLTVPEGFKKETITKDDQTITLFTNDKISIVYGVDNDVRNFYLYDKEKNELTNKLIPIKISNKILYLIDTQNEDKNLEVTKLKIEDTEFDCYKFKNQDNYYLLQTITTSGEQVKYLYESTENATLIYPSFLKTKVNATTVCSNNKVLTIILSCLLGILLIIILALLKKLKGSRNYA